MADRVLFISWGENVAGREERGLEVFNEAIGYYGRLQEEGRIESFDVVLLTPHGDIEGYVEIKGSSEQLAALMDDAEFLRLQAEATTIVHDVRVAQGYTGAGIAQMMEIYQSVLAKTPQMA